MKDRRLAFVRSLEKIVDNVELFSVHVLDEEFSKVVEERLVEPDSPEDVAVKAAHRNGAA